MRTRHTHADLEGRKFLMDELTDEASVLCVKEEAGCPIVTLIRLGLNSTAGGSLGLSEGDTAAVKPIRALNGVEI